MLPLAEFFKIPPVSIVPLTSYVASPILGISLLGPMIHSGEITNIQAMIVLMLGSMFMLPIFALRSQLPGKIAIFGTQLGFQIVIYSTAISVFVRLRNPSSTFKYRSIVPGLSMGASGARSQQYGNYWCGGSGTEDNGEGIVWRIFI